MSKIISVRIPDEHLKEILEECRENSSTVSEWLFLRIHIYERLEGRTHSIQKGLDELDIILKDPLNARGRFIINQLRKLLTHAI